MAAALPRRVMVVVGASIVAVKGIAPVDMSRIDSDRDGVGSY
jgi:hypothetical protein